MALMAIYTWPCCMQFSGSSQHVSLKSTVKFGLLGAQLSLHGGTVCAWHIQHGAIVTLSGCGVCFIATLSRPIVQHCIVWQPAQPAMCAFGFRFVMITHSSNAIMPSATMPSAG